MSNEKLFLDTNVVLDLLGEREPFYDAAAKIATLADEGAIHIVVSALSYSTVFYILSRFESKTVVKEKLLKFKAISQVSALTEKVVDKSLISKFDDFEDALQYYCAMESGCSMLITCNGKDFKWADIPVLTPDEYLKSR
jgi:Predicted nucleic acid-binding protein, contains PIN domain